MTNDKEITVVHKDDTSIAFGKREDCNYRGYTLDDLDEFISYWFATGHKEFDFWSYLPVRVKNKIVKQLREEIIADINEAEQMANIEDTEELNLQSAFNWIIFRHPITVGIAGMIVGALIGAIITLAVAR